MARVHEFAMVAITILLIAAVATTVAVGADVVAIVTVAAVRPQQRKPVFDTSIK